MAEVPEIVVYCDESCHDMAEHHPFMAIGSLWVHRDARDDLSRAFRRLAVQMELRGEIKWHKVSRAHTDAYRRLVDFFFDQHELRFRTIAVEQKRVKMELHGKDQELAFYKFYYEMLEKWLLAGNEYVILIDRKTNRGADRYTTLKTYLERHLRGQAWIADLTVIDSGETPLAQLCDLLTGAVAAAFNKALRPESAKEQLAQHIARRAGLASLQVRTPPSEDKFNIFRINLD
ncbi:MAG: DUF3800 domain-containing protein [Planctomycetota bacterium]|nr:DUF3800 domain-containing protein [Planctomycetota bacterium]